MEIISACSFFSMGVWEHINFTASEDDKSLKLFFAELSHGEAHWGTNHNTEAEKITACCLLEEGELCISFVPSYSHSGVFVDFYARIVFYHYMHSILYYCFWFVYYYYRVYQRLLWILSPWRQSLSPSSGIYSRDSLVIFLLFVEELPSTNMPKTIMKRNLIPTQ